MFRLILTFTLCRFISGISDFLKSTPVKIFYKIVLNHFNSFINVFF